MGPLGLGMSIQGKYTQTSYAAPLLLVVLGLATDAKSVQMDN